MDDWNDTPKEKRSSASIIRWIIIGLVVIALAFFIPYYISKVRATLVNKQLINICAGIERFREVNAENFPEDVWQLEDYGYVALDEKIKMIWKFDIVNDKTVTATSTYNKPGETPRVITLDIATRMITGYGIPPNGRDVSAEVDKEHRRLSLLDKLELEKNR